MIQKENSPTLCPRCAHFEKPHGCPGCKLISWDGEGVDVIVRRWMCEQDSERSWEYMGLCPRFEWNGSTPMYLRYPSGEQQPGGRMSVEEWLGQLAGSPARIDIARIVRGRAE